MCVCTQLSLLCLLCRSAGITDVCNHIQLDSGDQTKITYFTWLMSNSIQWFISSVPKVLIYWKHDFEKITLKLLDYTGLPGKCSLNFALGQFRGLYKHNQSVPGYCSSNSKPWHWFFRSAGHTSYGWSPNPPKIKGEGCFYRPRPQFLWTVFPQAGENIQGLFHS